MIEEFLETDAMFGRDREEVSEAHLPELSGEGLAHGGIDLVDDEGDGLAELTEQAGKVAIGTGDFGATIDEVNNLVGFFEGDAGLAEDLAGDELLIVGHDAAGVDEFEKAAIMFG